MPISLDASAGENLRMDFSAAGGKSRNCCARSLLESSAASALMSERRSPAVLVGKVIDAGMSVLCICAFFG